MAAGWSNEETRALVSVWGQANVQSELDSVARNRVVFQRIAGLLEELGYERTWQQCRTKIKNLTQKYRKAKDSNRVSGRDRTSCPFYEELDAILGTRAASTPAVLLESTSQPSTVNSEDVSFGNDSQPPTPPASSTPPPADMSTPIDYSLDSQDPVGGSFDTPETSGGSESQSASGIAGSSASRTSGSTTSEASGNGHTTDSTPSTRRGTKRKRKDSMISEELLTVLAKLDEQADTRLEERERKRAILDAELEERRREQERRHEERMQTMMFTFMRGLMPMMNTGSQPPLTQSSPYSPIAPYMPQPHPSAFPHPSFPSASSFPPPSPSSFPPPYSNSEENDDI